MKELKHVIADAGRYSIYVMLILALLQPFGIDTIKEGRVVFIFGQTFLCFVCLVITALLCNAVMGCRTGNVSWRKGFVYVLLFMLIACPMICAVLICFNSWFYTGNPFCFWKNETGGVSIFGFLSMTMQVARISVIISIIAIYQLWNDKLKYNLEEIKKINELLEQRQEKIEQEEEKKEKEAEESGVLEEKEEKQMVQFVGQGQNATLTLSPSDLIYVESMANYADVCYISDNEIRHSTLRITLKQVRETLTGIDYIAQCHRAFLVNLNFVLKLTERGSGYQLQLFGMEKQIPVSRTNTGIIREKLSISK